MSGTGIGQLEEGEIATKPVTQQKPFNLTKPKPKVIPQPEALLRETKANPVPKNLINKSVVDDENDNDERSKAKTESIRKENEDNNNEKKRFELSAEKRQTVEKFARAKEAYLYKMLICLNKALCYGKEYQNDEWYANVLKFSLNLIEN